MRAAPLAAYAVANSRDFYSARIGCHVSQPIYGVDLAAMCDGSVAATANRAEPNTLDERVSTWLAERRADWPAVTRLARGVTRVGNPEVAVPLVGLAALFSVARLRSPRF